MIFNLNPKRDIFLEKIYYDALKKFNSFYGLKFGKGVIEIIIVKDRKTIDMLKGKKTERWLVGWANGTSVYVIDRKNYEKDSSHKYSDERYSALIMHEMAHIFLKFFANSSYKPIWIDEGMSIYLSGQNRFKKKPKKFEGFLGCYDKLEENVYNEAGFFIEYLVKNFGKNKLLKLIKNLKEVNSKEKFEKLFKQTYGFEINYKEINKKFK